MSESQKSGKKDRPNNQNARQGGSTKKGAGGGKNSDKNQPGKAKQQKDQQDHGGVPYMRHKWILNIMHWKE